jgi:transcriptional regulator with GAF, ATPase, and Fis domain
MLHYPFPGNIRELQNLIERGVISAEDGAAIDIPHMFRREQLSAETLLAIGAHGALTAQSGEADRSLLDDLAQRAGPDGVSLHEIEQRLIREAVSAAGGNLAAAARRLGLTRAQLAYRMERKQAAPRRRRKAGP